MAASLPLHPCRLSATRSRSQQHRHNCSRSRSRGSRSEKLPRLSGLPYRDRIRNLREKPCTKIGSRGRETRSGRSFPGHFCFQFPKVASHSVPQAASHSVPKAASHSDSDEAHIHSCSAPNCPRCKWIRLKGKWRNRFLWSDDGIPWLADNSTWRLKGMPWGVGCIVCKRAKANNLFAKFGLCTESWLQTAHFVAHEQGKSHQKSLQVS